MISGKWLTNYGWISLLVVASSFVNVLTAAQHAGSVHWAVMRNPILDESTSALIIICLLPLLKAGVDTLSTSRDRRIAFIMIALAIVAYSLLHITFMGVSRQLAYGALGVSYDFHWRDQFVIEFRKDLISAFMIVVVFWLLDRRSSAATAITSQAATTAPRPEIWLRDGSNSFRVDPAQIISVASAGNYVEFALPGKRHLIRGTLSGEAARLKPFGLVRIHRTRLINIARVVAIETRANGDFLAKMDSGDVVAGSRRYKDAVGQIKGAAS